MPIPLSSNEIIHVDHKIKEASYSMPHMQAASDHYMLGYLVSGDRKWFSYENIKIAHSGDVGISKPNVYHRNCAFVNKNSTFFAQTIFPQCYITTPLQ